MLEEKNVRFYMNNGLAEIQGENGKVRLHRFKKNSIMDVLKHCHNAFVFQVKQVILQNGGVLPADVVIVGIGKYKKISIYERSYFCVSDFFFLFLVRCHPKL